MLDRQVTGESDRRWIVLIEDGRCATLGRARDPSEDEIVRAESSLKVQGLAGLSLVSPDESAAPYTRSRARAAGSFPQGVWGEGRVDRL